MKIEYKNPLIGYVDLSSLNMKEIFELTGANYERKENFSACCFYVAADGNFDGGKFAL